MRKWNICGALSVALLVLAAPSNSAREDRPCLEDRSWVVPINLIVRLDSEADGTVLDLFEAELDWVAQDLRIHELFLSRWLSVRFRIALIQVGPEAREWRPVPIEAAERRLGKLKAALENLPYVDAVQYNHVLCWR